MIYVQLSIISCSLRFTPTPGDSVQPIFSFSTQTGPVESNLGVFQSPKTPQFEQVDFINWLVEFDMADESEQTRMAGCLFFFFFWTHNGLKSNAFHRLDNLVIKCKKLQQTCFLFFFVFGFVPLQKLQKHFHCTLHEILSTKLNQDKARMSLPQGSGFKEGSGGFKTKGARGFKLGFFGSSCVSNWGFKGYGSKLGLKTIFGFQILV